MTQKRMTAAAVGIAAASLLCPAHASAQSGDALIDKLVQKGVLTVKEANELREENDKNFDQAYAVKSGMPEWVNALKFNGDFRGRFEGFYGDNPLFTDRNRFRYRLRFGVTANLFEGFEVGLRLTSSEAVGNFGGDPLSGNTSFNYNASKKFVYLDLAYAKWTMLNSGPATGAITIGKMENPFVFPSTILFDRDYTPEGAAVQFGYALSDKQALKLNTGAFVLDELSLSSHDPALFGAQLRLDSKWTPKLSSSVGAGIFSISNPDKLTNASIPNVNRGNTRNSEGAPVAYFNPVYTDATLTYTFDRAPLYNGAFPVSLGADYMYNPAVSQNNEGYTVGISFGKAGKKGQWELAYRWAELQSDAWFEEFTESDFGAYYQQQQPNAGFANSTNPTGSGYGSGTNVKGHILRLSWSPYNFLTLSTTAFLTELIKPVPGNSASSMTRVQVDAMFKF